MRSHPALPCAKEKDGPNTLTPNQTPTNPRSTTIPCLGTILWTVWVSRNWRTVSLHSVQHLPLDNLVCIEGLTRETSHPRRQLLPRGSPSCSWVPNIAKPLRTHHCSKATTPSRQIRCPQSAVDKRQDAYATALRCKSITSGWNTSRLLCDLLIRFEIVCNISKVHKKHMFV